LNFFLLCPSFLYRTLIKFLDTVKCDMMLDCRLAGKLDKSMYPAEISLLVQGFAFLHVPPWSVHESVRLFFERDRVVVDVSIFFP
jgi:hypothetical protein